MNKTFRTIGGMMLIVALLINSFVLPVHAADNDSDMLIYRGGGSTQIPEYNLRNNSGFLGESTAQDVGGALEYVKVKQKPQSSSKEKILCTKDAEDDVNCQVWDGSAWGNLVELSTNAGGQEAFDIAYETNSGEAMVCYRDNSVDSSIPQCNIWNGTDFNTEADAADVTTAIRSLKLIPDPHSSYMALLTRDSNHDINIQIWDGSTWAHLLEVEDAVAAGCNRCLPYDGAWESSGEFVAVWRDVVENEVEARVFNKTTFWGPQIDAVVTGMHTGNSLHIKAASNPNSGNDEIMVAVADDANDLYTNVWSGSSFGTQVVQSTNINGLGGALSPFGIAYEHSGSYDGILTYGRNSSSIHYRVWNSITASWGAEETFPTAVENKDWHQLSADPKSDKIMLTTVGITDDVDTIEWGGSAWDAAWTSHETASNDQFLNAWFTYDYEDETQGGGGGSFSSYTPLFPKDISLEINRGEECSYNSQVDLTFGATDAVEVLVSNNKHFNLAQWEPLNLEGEYVWELDSPDVYEKKTVYAMYRSTQGDFSNVITDEILFAPLSECDFPKKKVVSEIEASDGNGVITEILIETPGEADIEVIIEEPTVVEEVVESIEEQTETTEGNIGKKVECISQTFLSEYLQPGSTGTQVSALQSLLQCLGHFPSDVEVTGTYGEVTAQAVEDYQSQKAIEVVGVVGPITRSALNKHYKADEQSPVAECSIGRAISSLLGFGTIGEDVRTLQAYLQCLGHFPFDVETTTFFGLITRQALIQYQQALGLELSGVTNQVTLDKINPVQ